MAVQELTYGPLTQPPPVTEGPATEIISGVAGWAVLHRVADSGVSRFEAEFVKTVARASNNVNRQLILKALQNRNRRQALDIAVNAWNSATPAFKANVEASVVSTVSVAARRVSERVLTNPSAIQFDVTNPLATKWAREQSSLLVTNISANQRTTLQNILADGFDQGLTPQKIARNIRSGIGLQSRQQIALNRFEQDLVKKGVKPSTITKRVNSYRNKMIRQRSRAIARTELMRASNMGQQLLWEEAVAQGHLDPSKFEKVWITTPDDRLCPNCRAKRGAKVGVFDYFNNPVGNPEPQPPLHPMCRCSTALVKKGFKSPKATAPKVSTPTTGKVKKKKVAKKKGSRKTIGKKPPKGSQQEPSIFMGKKKAAKKVAKKKPPSPKDPQETSGIYKQFGTPKVTGEKPVWRLAEADIDRGEIGRQLRNARMGREVAFPSDRTVRSLGKKYPKEVDRHYGEYMEGTISNDERMSVSRYTQEMFMDFNETLRKNPDVLDEYDELIDAFRDAFRAGRINHTTMEKFGKFRPHELENLQNIQKVTTNAPEPPPPELVWRGVKGDMMESFNDGDVFELNGFQSSTIDPETALHFAQRRGTGVVMEIAPRRGTYVKSVSAYAEEEEFLLPHKSQFRVIGKKKIEVRETPRDPDLDLGATETIEVIQVEML